MVAPDVDGYIGTFPAQTQTALKQMRAAIRAAAPNAHETISYNMPAFIAGGEKLVWFAGFKSHIGFYPGSAAIAAFKAELLRYKTAKGSVQFSLSEPLPTALVSRIVKFRLQRAQGV